MRHALVRNYLTNWRERSVSDSSWWRPLHFRRCEKDYHCQRIEIEIFFFIIVFAFSININISFILEISNLMHDWWKSNTNIHFSIILSSDISKRITSNDIIIYDNVSTYDRFFVVADAYFGIWRDSEDIVNISKKNWM